jgi:hypothetical protein
LGDLQEAPGEQLPGDPSAPLPKPGTAGSTGMDNGVSEAIASGIASLTEMVPCHQFAEQALNILLYLAKQWNIEIRATEVAKDGGEQSEVNKLLTRPEDEIESRVRPSTEGTNFFVPIVKMQDIMCPRGQGPPPGVEPAIGAAVSRNAAAAATTAPAA